MPHAATGPGNRLLWLDYSRGFAILLVVSVHVTEGLEKAGLFGPDTLPSRIENATGTWSMALFFYISGMFFSRTLQQPAGEFATGRAKAFLYPYVVWVVLHAMAVVAAGSSGNDEYSLSELYRATWEPPWHYWFLYVMLFSQVLYYVLRRLRVPATWILVGAFAFMLTHTHMQLWPDWGILYQVRQYVVYFALGAVMSRTGPILKLSNAPTRLVAVMAVVGVPLMALMDAAGFGDVNSLRFVASLIGGTAVVCVSILLKRSGWLGIIAVWGRHSLEIYLAHVIFLAAARIALVKAGVELAPVHWVAGMIAGLFLPILLGRAMERLGFHHLFSLKPTKKPEATPRDGAAVS